MLHTSRHAALAAAVAGALAVAGCERDAPTAASLPTSSAAPAAAARGENPGTHRQYGTPVKVGNGLARSYIVLDHGVPSEIGIALSARALDGLPSSGMMYPFLLPLPAQNPTPVRLVELDWNPMGHPPPMIYTVPHFDFHFYTISLAERNAIDPSDPNFAAEAANFPDPAFIPTGYVPPPGPPSANAVPQMGLHWTDPASPEFQGQGFTRTFLYGTWNGKLIFMEPMVTRDYLLTHPDDLLPVPTASRHDPTGYYPTEYRVQWDAQAKEWHIAIAGLEAFSQ
jgi:hypothetical protein